MEPVKEGESVKIVAGRRSGIIGSVTEVCPAGMYHQEELYIVRIDIFARGMYR